VVGLSQDKTEATVQGTVILRMPGNDICYTGKFVSVCVKDKIGKDWKLGEIRIDWE